MVLNALDNVDARRHVNRMCLATNKPMIDAGTTGYVGQVNVIRKEEAACYECEEKPTQKVGNFVCGTCTTMSFYLYSLSVSLCPFSPLTGISYLYHSFYSRQARALCGVGQGSL